MLWSHGWATLIFNNSLWDWELGLQRDTVLYSNEIACCGVMGGRHLMLTTPYGIGSLVFRGSQSCIVMGLHVVSNGIACSGVMGG